MEERKEANKPYIKEKVHPILERMITKLLVSKPEEPLDFMIAYLQRLKSKLTKQKPKTGPIEGNESYGSEGESFSDDSNEEFLEDISPKKKGAKGNRGAISSEAYGKYNKKGDFKARVIPKTLEQKQKISDKLLGSFLFNSLEKKDLDTVIDAIDIVKAQKGDYVIKQGDDGDSLYIIEEGTYECNKLFAGNEAPTHFKTYEPGEAFGELALMYNAPRAANIIANEDGILFAIDRDTFSNIVKDATIKKRERYEKFLAQVKILSTMEMYERSQLADVLKAQQFKAGDYIIKQGEEGNIFYLLETGTAYATRSVEGKSEEKVMDYKVGDYFGELALLSNEPRAANVIAADDVNVVYMDRHSFKRLLGPLEDILKRNASMYIEFIKE